MKVLDNLILTAIDQPSLIADGKNRSKGTLYVDYTKGIETGVDLLLQFSHPFDVVGSEDWHSRAEEDNAGLVTLKPFVINSSGKYHIPAPGSNTDDNIRLLAKGNGLALSSLVVQDITYTSKIGGVAGDNITITYIVAGNNTALSVPPVIGNNIVVNLATNGVGASISDANAIDLAIKSEPSADALVSSLITGVGTTVQVALVQTALAGGQNGGLVTAILQY